MAVLIFVKEIREQQHLTYVGYDMEKPFNNIKIIVCCDYCSNERRRSSDDSDTEEHEERPIKTNNRTQSAKYRVTGHVSICLNTIGCSQLNSDYKLLHYYPQCCLYRTEL